MSTANYWAIAAVAINPAPTLTTYDLTLSVDPSEGGTTNPAAGIYTYDEDEVVDIEAIPATGYNFDYWEGDVADVISASTTVTMDEDQSVIAHFTEDEDAALAYVVANTTITGDLTALTATFPPSIPAVIVDEDYKINSRMTLTDPLPAGSTVSIMITVNGAGPVPYVTDALIPASPFWVTDLFDPAAVAADFDAGYGGRIELYNITITGGGGNPEPINTTLAIESIISKDDFASEEVLAVLNDIPVYVDEDEDITILTMSTIGSGTVTLDPAGGMGLEERRCGMDPAATSKRHPDN